MMLDNSSVANIHIPHLIITIHQGYVSQYVMLACSTGSKYQAIPGSSQINIYNSCTLTLMNIGNLLVYHT